MGRKKKKFKVLMEWCYFNDGIKKRRLNVNNIEPDDYKSKYRGNLTCICGCEARIKFTNKKNGKKILSTWNKEGKKHDPDICPYYVEYRNVKGRNKLIEKSELGMVSDEKVEASLKRKFKNLMLKFNQNDINIDKNYNSKIINDGEKNIYTVKNDDTGETKSINNGRISYMESETINDDYNMLIRGIIGNVDNIYISEGKEENEEGLEGFYGYINLKSNYNKIHVYFPQAYYEGNEYKLKDLKRFLEILRKENKSKNMIVACYGMIKRKDDSKNGFNINIINPKHIIINGMTVKEILNKCSIEELEGDEIII
ncbi:hypothetical protein [Clostridium perfringens]|uniref:Uncharacterized protein n=3 Tax=Clostridium perfringens TaxID=1502 RepID=A0AAP7BX19_CLOPF|nr:hypothetical protein [Clostridium perfringens]EDT23637.1 hypothetical protein AC1_0056 [Clostridium perfringens B str. ATCC 3626]MCX0366286.1 hypothetical protein [Clostridium perfringens]MDM0578881.1 hypothetical protein [Clostridium perfringens]NGU31434.1 hypothetical protein [Clostridium perfringens]WEV05467.1 hypothetical protein PL322_00260 [Clostridium perfringens B]